MEQPGSESFQKFGSPEEEIAYLRQQVALRERALAESGQTVEGNEVAQEQIDAYKQHAPEEVLSPDMVMQPHETKAVAIELALEPDQDDEAVASLMHVMQEKGVKNALSVVENMNNPHLEDDFHRALAQMLKEGHPIMGVSERSPLWDELSMTLYEVSLPEMGQDDQNQNKSLKELVSSMEQFYAGMFSIADEKTLGKRHFTLEVAVSEKGQEIIFYIAVPNDKKDLFEKQIAGLFPNAQIHEQNNDYNIFVHDGVTRIAHASVVKDAVLPLKIYEQFDHDPLNVIINSFSKFAHEGEGAAIQMVMRPVGEKYGKRYKKILEQLQKGKSYRDALAEHPDGIGGEIMKFGRMFVREFQDKEKLKEQERENQHVDQLAVEAVQEKVGSRIMTVNLRVAVSAPDTIRAETMLSEIVSSFNQFSNTNGNSLKFTSVAPKRMGDAVRQFSFRQFSTGSLIPLTLREITTILHFPKAGTIHTSREFKQSRAKMAPAPMGLPMEGTLLGINTYRGVETSAFMTPKDRVRHMYVIGQTGTGKTNILKNMIVQDIENGDGCCFIDPHGSDVDDILSLIPEERYDDVIYFDPAYTERVMALNMLECDPAQPEQKTFVINELFSIFKKLYAGTPESMGPAFEQYFRNATALVIEDPASGNTMLDISRVLADEAYRNLKLSRSKNVIVNQFWQEIATKAQGEASLANIVPYITNKFDIFTANDIMRPIIAQAKSTFNFRDLMDNRKILLVNLAKGRLGDINANLIGLILIGKILMAALSRVDAIGDGRSLPAFYLYIDEFQNITTDSISAILSEARKYSLSLNVAHQYIAQLDEGIRDAVFGNVGNMAVFRVGAEDAEFLSTQFEPTFTTSDIMNIDNFNCYLKMLANGKPMKPFNVHTIAPREGSPERAAYLKQLSYLRFGKRSEDINKMINKRYGIG